MKVEKVIRIYDTEEFIVEVLDITDKKVEEVKIMYDKQDKKLKLVRGDIR